MTDLPVEQRLALAEQRAREAEAEVVSLRRQLARPSKGYCVRCGFMCPHAEMAAHVREAHEGNDEVVTRLGAYACALHAAILSRDLALIQARYVLLDKGLSDPLLDALFSPLPPEPPEEAHGDTADATEPPSAPPARPRDDCLFCQWAVKVILELVATQRYYDAQVGEGVRAYREALHASSFQDADAHLRAVERVQEWERTRGRLVTAEAGSDRPYVPTP